MVPIHRLFLASAFSIALLFAAAGAASSAGEDADKAPKVVASIFPLQALAAGVMEGVATPELLLDANRSPHDFALKPSQVRQLQEADLVIWVGEGLEYPLARYAANLPDQRSLALAAGAGAHGNEDADGNEAGHEDPHIWLDPRAAKKIVVAIAGRLGSLDPDRAARYEENAARLAAKLDALEVELTALLLPLETLPYIVFHDAYGPFERRFGLANAGAVTAHPEDPPSAARIRRMRAIVTERGALCLFHERQFETRAIAAIAEGSDIRIGELDPLGIGLNPGVDGYLLLLRGLARNYAACLAPERIAE
jgi:zinc transport system substrate-binding protein